MFKGRLLDTTSEEHTSEDTTFTTGVERYHIKSHIKYEKTVRCVSFMERKMST